MRKKVGMCIVFSAFFWVSCQETELPSELTGNEMVYTFQPGPVHGLTGLVFFQEKKDNSTLITVNLNSIKGDTHFPAHLHFGGLSESGSDIAAILNPVKSNTGVSNTTVSQLADETRVTYNDIIKMAFCIKVHLSDIGPEKDIIIAGVNVGSLSATTEYGKDFGLCKSK